MNTKTIHEYHFYAMGSHMTVWLQWGTDAEARPILCQAQAQFEAADVGQQSPVEHEGELIHA
jgi:hypothetical protein